MSKILDKILNVIKSGNYYKYYSRIVNNYFHYTELDLYTPLFDCLKKRVKPDKNKLKLIQDAMKVKKIVIYRYNKAEKHL